MKYYLHDTNAFQDEKVTMLFIEFGFEAVGLFYVILEKLANQEKPIIETVLKSQLNIKKKLQKQLDFMYKIGILSVRNGEVFNENLANFSEKYKVKKEKTRKRVSEWRENQPDAKTETCYKDVRNSSKVKESKVKESKVKEKKHDDNIIFLFDSIKPFFSKQDYSKSDYDKSLYVLEKMIRLDKHTEVEIIEVLSLKEKSFYGANVQSIQSLRVKKEGTSKFQKLKTYLQQQIKQDNAAIKKSNSKEGCSIEQLEAITRATIARHYPDSQ